MKVIPLLSTSPKLLAHAEAPTETPGYAVHLDTILDPKDGHRYLVIGVGSGKRTQRARLTKAEALDMIVKLQPLAMML